MAGTARIVKRMWSLISQTQGSSIEDPFKAFYEELNNLNADVEALRTPSTSVRLNYPNTVPVFSENGGTDSDLDISAFTLVDSDGLLRAYKARTVTTLTTMTVTLDTYGAYVWEATNTGTVSSQTPDATSSYATQQLALTAALALTPAANTVFFAVTLIEADAGDWVANTDDFTSDLDGFGAITLGGASILASALTSAAMTTPESQD